MTSSSENYSYTSQQEDGVVLSVSTALVDPSDTEVRECQEEYGEEMSCDEKRILCLILKPTPPLPYPLKPLPMPTGQPAMEYQIPDSDKAEILRLVYPFTECPDLDATRYDLHEGRDFKVRDFKVIRERGRNMLVSPYYSHSGGMVVDWMQDKESGCACNRLVTLPDVP